MTEQKPTSAASDAAPTETPFSTASGTQPGAGDPDAAADAAQSAAADPAGGDSPDGAAPDAPNGRAVDLERLTPGPSEPQRPTDATPSADAAGLLARIAELEGELRGLEDQKLRLMAEVQNTVRRAERERRDAELYGGTKLARDLLNVYDNLDAAIGHASEELREREPGFFNGVELTRKELLKAFGKHKIEVIAPEPGARFDPNVHQAMYEAPAPGAEPGSVIQVMQAGFTIADRLLRPASVGVASAASAPAAQATETPADADS